MACDISLVRLEACKDSVGGLKAVYFMNYADVPAADIVYDATDTDVVETLNDTPSTISAYKYELKGNSTFEQNINASRENGTMFVEQVLNISLKKQDLATHKEIKLISYGRPKVIVEDYNNNFFVMVIEHGADVTAGTIMSGASMGDMNGYTLTLTAQERSPANFMDATTELALAAAGVTVVVGA